MIEIKPIRIDTIGQLKDFLLNLPESVSDSDFINPEFGEYMTVEYNSVEGLMFTNNMEPKNEDVKCVK